ncbi:hypothetical protein [Bacillus fonticola]|uniref:hypothetical protein n=1 Tax=Bacillus fonticola TaxID=2728853 RepID=UPI0014748F29|nr:hypothetical protein [Bacillus fonticola]
MRTTNVLPGWILIGFGLYIWIRDEQWDTFASLSGWQTLLIIVGIAMLLQAYKGRDYTLILPGTFLTGVGIHFQVVGELVIWPEHLGAFSLFLALGFLLQHQKTGQGLLYGVLFLIMTGMVLFYDQVTSSVNEVIALGPYWRLWPLLLVAFGCYVLFFKKR